MDLMITGGDLSNQDQSDGKRGAGVSAGAGEGRGSRGGLTLRGPFRNRRASVYQSHSLAGTAELAEDAGTDSPAA